MKKTIIALQIVVLVFILLKGMSLIGWFTMPEIMPGHTLSANQAYAQPAQTEKAVAPATSDASPVVSTKPPKKDIMDDTLNKQRDLAAALLAKKIELDNRENSIKSEELRLIALKKEITEKITFLKGQEEKIAAIIDANQTSENKRFKEMAKVYESTPPAKAGPMLEKLDTKTAAGITMNMKKDKAGAIWGYITPQKAVEITKEITRVSKSSNQ